MSEIERAGAALGQAIEAKMATKDDIAEVKGDIAELKADVSGLKADVSQLKTDVSGLKGDMRRMEGLTPGLIAALNANTRSMETALNDAGIPVRLTQAAKTD